MELITAFLTFWAASPWLGTLLVIILFVYDKRTASKTEGAIHQANRKCTYNNLRFMEDQLDVIVTQTGINMANHLTDNQYNFDQTINQELYIYNSVVREAFRVDIHAKSKQSILENGFDHMSNRELEDLVLNKGKDFYNKAQLLIKVRTKGLIPNISMHVGDNFTEEQASHIWKHIVDNCLENYKHRDNTIKEIKGRHSIGRLIKQTIEKFTISR